jgi:NAD(P)-dependent dehydrogenase (short-subunit alcohol dehydrogenase family)
MKLMILGATGGTGQELVKQALADGHEVTVYVRNRAKLNMSHDRLKVVEGTMAELDKMSQAMAGSAAVLSALGPTSNTPARPLTEGMQNVITAMKQQNVQRLIVSTGAGVADPNDKPQLIGRLFGLALRLFARHVLADSQGMVAAVRGSDRAWTLARAPRLNDKPASGRIKVGYAGQGPGTQLSRADFARFMLDQVQSDKWVGKAPMLSN